VLLAGTVFLAMAALGNDSRQTDAGTPAAGQPRRDDLASSLLLHILATGGMSRDDATRLIRRETGIAAVPTGGVDVSSWSESFARQASDAQRHELLENAVKLVACPGRPVPLRQYAALLDLSFGLGFQTDALARLRTVYGFDYVDPARAGRPRSADRPPLFEASGRNEAELRAVLGVSGSASREEIVLAYRRLAAKYHPDRYHGEAPEREAEAADRFIAITHAYEELLSVLRR
jgi:hypothetical protein